MPINRQIVYKRNNDIVCLMFTHSLFFRFGSDHRHRVGSDFTLHFTSMTSQTIENRLVIEEFGVIHSVARSSIGCSVVGLFLRL